MAEVAGARPSACRIALCPNSFAPMFRPPAVRASAAVVVAADRFAPWFALAALNPSCPASVAMVAFEVAAGLPTCLHRVRGEPAASARTVLPCNRRQDAVVERLSQRIDDALLNDLRGIDLLRLHRRRTDLARPAVVQSLRQCLERLRGIKLRHVRDDVGGEML